jgi:hypothetical protein
MLRAVDAIGRLPQHPVRAAVVEDMPSIRADAGLVEQAHEFELHEAVLFAAAPLSQAAPFYAYVAARLTLKVPCIHAAVAAALGTGRQFAHFAAIVDARLALAPLGCAHPVLVRMFAAQVTDSRAARLDLAPLGCAHPVLVRMTAAHLADFVHVRITPAALGHARPHRTDTSYRKNKKNICQCPSHTVPVHIHELSHGQFK